MPLVFLIFYLFYLVLTPAQNGFSRVIERAADRFALKAFPHPDVFISCMDKLGKVNFSDPNPHPLIEWFFYDHPAIGKRIQLAREWKK
ncbi:MAG TPA: M48 family metalloprotease [bacterium]|nr:M48 family metalloprotease [bacterium]